MSLNPQATPNPQAQPASSTVTPVTATNPRPIAPSAPLSLKKEEPSKPQAVTAKPQDKASKRSVTKEQRESLLVTRLLNLTDFLGLSKEDLVTGKSAVEKRLKALQSLERKLTRHLEEREKREHAQERSRIAQEAMDLFLAGKKEDGAKLFDEYRAKYGNKKK